MYIGPTTSISLASPICILFIILMQLVNGAEENIGLDSQIPRERYISPERRQQIINDLKLI